ncbi:MAG TPA: tRNA lysidine(34) synthetase TilS, partial [Firmicutes bacterium]|nr:tRNA lysidine(34) synthetase TilS [Bacillota bacterium]
CHDPYNDDPRYLRNRIRHDLLPWLAEHANRRIKDVLVQSAAIWQAEEDYLAAAAAEAYQRSARAGKAGVELRVAELNSLPLALRRRVVRLAHTAVSPVEVKDLGFAHTEAVLALLDGGSGRALNLPHGVRVERFPCHLLFSRRPPAPVPAFLYPLAVPGSTAVPELGYTVHTFLDGEGAPAAAQNSLVASAVFDYNVAGSQLFARNWRPGDWFIPRGLTGSKKLSDFFIDAKIPRSERSRVLIIATADNVVWVAGLREDDRFAAGPQTTQRIRIEVRRADCSKKEGETHEQHQANPGR